MTKKIFLSIFSICGLVFLASMLLTFFTIYSYFTSVEENQLHSGLELVAQGYEDEGLKYLKQIEDAGYRISLIEPDGDVVYDSQEGSKNLGNHGDREEVKEALETGFGESSRYSETLTERALYAAVRVSSGEILRISVSHYSVIALMMGVATPLIQIFCGAIIAALILAIWISRKIVQPLESMDLDHPEQTEVYEELKPIVNRLRLYKKDIQRQKRKLAMATAEFRTVADAIEEGMILLDRDLNVLNVNPAAARILGIQGDLEGKAFSQICQIPEVLDMVRQTETGQAGSRVVTQEDRAYLFQVKPVHADGKIRGCSVLMLDVTERQQVEQMRKEFTGNVSHELKTPLQTISGYSELMEQGLARQEDIPVLSGKILGESRRMTALVEEILTLSKMDEEQPVKKVETDLAEIAGSVARELEYTARKEQVDLVTEIPEAPLELVGDPAMLRSILFNLLDNAVKYNQAGGQATLTLRQEPEQAVIEVTDNGCGIPVGEQERIFERFYRVDKSRSRARGGTGLGLAIVKNAVRLHDGTVNVFSRPGEGSRFIVKLPLNGQE